MSHEIDYDISTSQFCKVLGEQEIKKLYKSCLFLLEELEENEYIPSDIFEEKRNLILTWGNNCIRRFDNGIDNYFDIFGDKR